MNKCINNVHCDVSYICSNKIFKLLLFVSLCNISQSHTHINKFLHKIYLLNVCVFPEYKILMYNKHLWAFYFFLTFRYLDFIDKWWDLFVISVNWTFLWSNRINRTKYRSHSAHAIPCPIETLSLASRTLVISGGSNRYSTPGRVSFLAVRYCAYLRL